MVMAAVLLAFQQKILPLIINIQTFFDSKTVQVLTLFIATALGIFIYFLLMFLFKSKDIREFTERFHKRNS